MRVIATAGHVDHGKSTLIRALTGIDPDRLPEERERGMTIDLGFAWLRLPGSRDREPGQEPQGEEVGIVDVPGHQDFVRNMLAGVGGIDAVLLVVALDEGAMPQTREHLAILRLLGVEKGIVALTKRDLVDAEWASLVREDVRRALHGTPLADAPFVEVSAIRESGLAELVATVERVLGAVAARRDLGRPRLPIDRAFTMTGFGTVVTGTLRDGAFALGEEVEIVPGGLKARVRGLQTHRQKIERAVPGSRVAINIAGADSSAVRRGMVVARPDSLRPASILTARLTLLADASRALEHDATVKLYVGTAEAVARVSLLEAGALEPGAEGWAQLRLAEPVAAMAGDRFVLRLPSPAETVGGGVIADLSQRRLRRRPESIAALERAGSGDLAARVGSLLAAPLTRNELERRLAVPPDEVRQAVGHLIEAGELVELAPFLLSRGRYDELRSRARASLHDYHGRHPLRRGMPKEELRTSLQVEAKLWAPLVRRLVADGALADRGAVLASPEHRVALPAELERTWQLARERLRANESQPPSASALGLTPEAVAALAERGELVRLADDLVLLPETARRFGEAVIAEAAAAGHVTVARARDLTGSSRKYVLPLLQFLDDIGATRRAGEERVLATSPEEGRARLVRATSIQTTEVSA
jgi:selenocysteine-specific elongation factor